VNNNNGLIAGVVAIVASTLVCATAIYIFAPESADLAPLLALPASAIPALITLGKVNSVDAKVEQVDRRTEELSNGLMDAKIRAGVADVIRPEHVDPEAVEQLEADRARRDERAH
jgi:hypothetical protein